MDLAELIKQPWFAALLGALVGATIAGFINIGLAIYKTSVDRKAASNAVQREFHIKRKEHLQETIAILIELRWLILQARNIAGVIDDAVREERQEAAKEFYQKYHLAHAKIDELITKSIVQAEQYGKFPKGTAITLERLSPFVAALIATNPMKIIIEQDIPAATILNFNHNVTHLIRDMRSLIIAEEQLAVDVNGTKKTYKVPVLPYLAKVQGLVESPLTALDSLDVSIVNVNTVAPSLEAGANNNQ
jgi:hypothetical protein